MLDNIIVTTGIYDLVKDQVRRKKVTQSEEDLLNNELKFAQQVLRKDLPEDRVTVNRKVTIKDHTLNSEDIYFFVDSNKEKRKKGKYSITSNIALAVIGRKTGDSFLWPFKEGERKLEILNVEEIQD
ncbi:GreA/GreB family elongation factor [Moheibacter lacus]|uniref:GreA/GreB family elongation factor n=1 Tax=Moheibacter lacus TaxID=2745851 RepID=A0A838ZUG7_9FLAO|nr:GreA/GreB family elongation factor [Moheibacter lacus]MBA5630645.1 GreA/GreB family elongation factor [Moheibacter lacus]